MKKQLPLNFGPKDICGKCTPCIAMQKLKEKQNNIPEKCTSRRKEPSPQEKPELIASIYAVKSPKKHHGDRGDGNSSSSDSDSVDSASQKKSPKRKLPKKKSEMTVCIGTKPATSVFKKPSAIKREESEEMVYIRRPKGVNREESFESVCSKVPKSVKREASDETVISKMSKCIKGEESNETVFSRKPKGAKRKSSDDTVSTSTRSKKKEDGEEAVHRQAKLKKPKRKPEEAEKKVDEESGKCVRSKKDDKQQQKKLQARASNTSIPDEGINDYADYIPRMCIHQKKRPRSREIRAGISYIGCDCAKRNGLQDQCMRTECQGCPKCKQFPPACYLSRFSNARHLTSLKDAGIKKRCPQ